MAIFLDVLLMAGWLALRGGDKVQLEGRRDCQLSLQSQTRQEGRRREAAKEAAKKQASKLLRKCYSINRKETQGRQK
jgi:hypothetical protein